MARTAGFIKGQPIDTFNRNFYILAISTVKAAYIASFILKDKEITSIDGLTDLNKVEESILKKLSVNVDGEFLRSRFFVRAGTAPKDPFIVSSASKAAKDMKFIQTKNNLLEKPFDFTQKYKLADLVDKAIKHIEDAGITPSENLKAVLNSNNVPKYSDLMQIEISFEQIGDYSDTFHYKINIDFKLSHRLYTKVISSDDVAQNTYLLSLWLHNNFQASANRGRIIVDPRRVVANTQRLISEYGPPKARTNSDGYALFKSGIPIKIPSDQRNYIDKLIAAGNAAVDENGFFNPDLIAENTNLTNKVVYVDWYNDLMVYTSATGMLQTLSLRGTSKLSAFDEWAFLRTPMIDPRLSFVNRIVTSLVSTGVSFEEFSAEYTRSGGSSSEISGSEYTTYANVYANLATLSGRDGAVNVTYAHMCGFDMERIKNDVSSRSSYSPASKVFTLIKAAGAYFRAFAKKAEEDSTNMWNLPNFAQPQGMRALLEGVNYLIFTASKKTAKDMDILFKAYEEETEKWKTEKITKIKIPNVKIGVGGMQGLLPHQARIASSQIKSPKYQVLSISTGGGKTISSFIDSSTAILNDPTVRPLISTKGNLIHNTISEINAITGGQFNAIPFTPVVIRRLKSQSGIKTVKQLMTWVKSLPPNTLLVNSYSNFGSKSILFDEMPHDEAFADMDIGMSQYNKILRLCNINKITGDESHLIKNVISKRSRGAYAAMAAAEYRTLMSGTLVANTVKDLVGQVNAATPAVFGDNVEKFCDDYNIAYGGILTDESAEKIKRKLDSSLSWQQATPDEWGYMLPDTNDIISFVKMSPKQEKFYNDMLKAAMLEIEKSMKDKNGGKDDDSDDEEGDDEEEDENSDDAFVASASKHLMGVEDFLVAPDANEIFVAQKGADKPTGDDLISPKVLMADQIISKHLTATANDAKNNKIIVFGWSLNGIRHFQKHSKYGKDAIVYFAGDNEAIRQFKNDPSKRIMIAAETSIREGENLQMCSLIIRLQAVWTPGDHTQARARMYRPDPRGIYNRDSLVHQWVLLQKANGEPSLDGLKIARLSSKQVHNARVTYEGRMEWKKVSKSFDDISTFKMNLDNLLMTRASDVAPYFDAWRTYNAWEMGLNQEQRYKKAKELEAISGEDLIDDKTGKIRDINKFISLAMVEVEPVTIPGSRKVYTPWVPRVIPADPDGSWGWNTIGNQPLKEGDVVYIEYGPGVISWVKDKSARVDCYGGRFYTLSRQMMCFPNDKKKAELAAIVKDPVKWYEMSQGPSALPAPSKKQKFITPETKPDKPTLNPYPNNGPVPDKPSVVKPTKPVKEEEEDDRIELDVVPIILNGFPALVIQEDVPDLKKLDGWNKVDPYISVQFRTWAAIDKFLDQLNTKFYMSQDFLDKLDLEIEALRSGKAVTQMRKLATGQLRDFIRDQHKKLGFKTLSTGKKEPIIRPYFITVDRMVRIAFDIDSHDPSVIRFIRGLKGDPRVAKIVEVKHPVWFNIFKDISEARRDIASLKSLAQFDINQINQDLIEIGKELKELAAPRRQPNV